jgi:hypothetical protein
MTDYLSSLNEYFSSNRHLAKESTCPRFDEGADFLDVGAGANVLEVRAVLHFVKVWTVSLAQECRAASFGQLASRFGKEWASASRLKMLFLNVTISSSFAKYFRRNY